MSKNSVMLEVIDVSVEVLEVLTSKFSYSLRLHRNHCCLVDTISHIMDGLTLEEVDKLTLVVIN